MKTLLVATFIIFGTAVQSQEINRGIFVLAVKTITGQLKTTDFSNAGNYFITVDTITINKKDFDFKYNEFQNKKSIVKAANKLFPFLSDAEIVTFRELNNNFLYEYKKHWIMKMIYNDREFIVQWWFGSDGKLEGLTIS